MPYYRKARRTSRYTGRRSARTTSRRRSAPKRTTRSSVQTVRLVIEQRPPVTDADLPIGMRQASSPKRARF